MKYTVQTKRGSTYTVDPERKRYRRNGGPWISYVEIFTKDVRPGVRLSILQDDAVLLQTSLIVRGPFQLG